MRAGDVTFAAARLPILMLALLAGCESDHFPRYIPDQSYPNGHPLVVNEIDPSLEQTEQDLITMTNQVRATAGLSALENSSSLSAVARGHSAHMPIHFFYDHVNPEGDGPVARLASVAKGWSVQAENISLVNDGTSAADIFAGFMGSPDHKANLLSPIVSAVGVGVVRGRHYLLANQLALYVTMEFVWKE
ncbi:MAG TPA: CAP domain-containing protein [Planctomycetota bacterium]|nr:CAP domain-containing protein [Planctomycetota bacterium]